MMCALGQRSSAARYAASARAVAEAQKERAAKRSTASRPAGQPVMVVAGPRARTNVVGVQRERMASSNMMQWWHARQERRRQWRQWRDENKGVSNPQFRKMVEAGSTWYQTPGKQQWAEQELQRREHHLTDRNIKIAGLILTFIGVIIGLLALWK
jgi:hypothetical protein